MKLKHLFFLIFFQLIVVSFTAQETSFIAGTEVMVEFNVKGKTYFQLYCTNGYGSTVIEPIMSDKKTSFIVPSFLTKKRGLLSWKTILKGKTFSGKISILPQQQPTSIETYLGPPSIDAGGKDFTMLVVMPTDSLDNPILDNSKVSVKHQFLKLEKSEDIFTDKLIGYKNIYAPKKSGRMVISSESYGLTSKEFDVNIMPGIATNFKIFALRNHEYADGNQITTLYTSTIKDKNKNIVSDASYIEFYITNKEGGILLGIWLLGAILSCVGIGLLIIWIPGIIGLIEGIIYLTKSDEEFYNTYQVGKKPWF